MNKGQRVCIVSERVDGVSFGPIHINWYGAYEFSQGQALIWQKGKVNSEHTVQLF
jgi:hypothetical protein